MDTPIVTPDHVSQWMKDQAEAKQAMIDQLTAKFKSKKEEERNIVSEIEQLDEAIKRLGGKSLVERRGRKLGSKNVAKSKRRSDVTVNVNHNR
jgi:predicted  nucleic acid-binding Zn-ribbon protein